ncbi:MAG: hypothetical protein AAGI68_02555 [Planctomycetota bacterium]
MGEISSFPPGVAERLAVYVYRLIDPRNGETFYIGKGQGDRVFAHIRAVVEDDQVGEKIGRIQDIRNAGFEVAHVIHRHGMDTKTALEVEAALIDAYPGLTNLAGGHGSSEYGVMHAQEVVRRYAAEEAVFRHRCILISINVSIEEASIYEAVRYAWRLSLHRAERAELVLAVSRGLIVDVFVPECWQEATADHFPGRVDVPGRYGFHGKVAEPTRREMYRGCRVPDRFRKRGASNPIKYTYR